MAEGTERRVLTNRQNAGVLFPAQGTTLVGHSSTNGQEAPANCLSNLPDSPCHKLSVIVGSSLFLFGVFLLAARDTQVLPRGGHIEKVVGPDFLAAYAADGLENHLLPRIPDSALLVQKDPERRRHHSAGGLGKGMHALDTDIELPPLGHAGSSDLELPAQIFFVYNAVANITDGGSHTGSPFSVDSMPCRTGVSLSPGGGLSLP